MTTTNELFCKTAKELNENKLVQERMKKVVGGIKLIDEGKNVRRESDIYYYNPIRFEKCDIENAEKIEELALVKIGAAEKWMNLTLKNCPGKPYEATSTPFLFHDGRHKEIGGKTTWVPAAITSYITASIRRNDERD